MSPLATVHFYARGGPDIVLDYIVLTDRAFQPRSFVPNTVCVYDRIFFFVRDLGHVFFVLQIMRRMGRNKAYAPNRG